MDKEHLIVGEFIPFLSGLADKSLKAIPLLSFDKKNPQHLYAVCLYGTIIEIAHGCLALIEKKQLTTLPILLRSLLEAYSDFLNIIRDGEYYKNMYASFLEEKLRLVKKAQDNQDNPYLKDIIGSTDLEKDRLNLEREINNLKAENRAPLNILDRFLRANLKNEYQSIYWLLCLHTHNSVSALEDRHIEKNGDDYQIVIFKEEDPADLLRYFDALGFIFLDSGMQIYQLLKASAVDDFHEYEKKLNELRNQYEKYLN